jgi:phenylacetate-CoA ligase
LHIASDIRHVDVVEGNRPVAKGEYGDLIITDLLNRKFPLIRYRIGDRGRLLDRRCSCGAPFPLMDYVKGRISDAIVLPSGDRIPGEYWTTIFDDYTDEVKAFQVHQAKDLSITVRYEPNRYVDCSGLVSKVRAKLFKKLGHGAVLEFVETDVDTNDNGKTRFVVSEVKT